MKILPPELRPWRAAFVRRHSPPLATGDEGYRDYRQCLRWEFGFTCSFCLCHEADLALDGAEGTGITQTEHWIPVSKDRSKVNDYSNCFYICRYCNNSRGAMPIAEVNGEGRLLNPCRDAWATSFSLSDGMLIPRTGDPSARYTARAYDLNDTRKIQRRRRRQTVIRGLFEFIEQAKTLREELLSRIANAPDVQLVSVARILEGQLRKAWNDLARYQATPVDSQCPCSCQDESLCQLPGVVAEQIIDCPPLVGGQP